MESKGLIRCFCGNTPINPIQKPSTIYKSVNYLQCQSCGLIIAPESFEYDLCKIYNNRYFTDIDSGWKGRAKIVLVYILYLDIFLHLRKMHFCDYGAGSGYLSKLLLDHGFRVHAFEPFPQENTYLQKEYVSDTPFQVDVLLMVEVFEHFTNALEEIKHILVEFEYPKLILFTTSLSDNAPKQIETWNYISPDSGHFTIWSRKSLEVLENNIGYTFISLDNRFFHVLCHTSYLQIYKQIYIASLLPRAFGFVYNFLKRIHT